MPTLPGAPKAGHRRIVIAIVLVAVVLIALLAVAAYPFFFGAEAPDAPSLEDAPEVLLPSATPR